MVIYLEGVNKHHPLSWQGLMQTNLFPQSLARAEETLWRHTFLLWFEMEIYWWASALLSKSGQKKFLFGLDQVIYSFLCLGSTLAWFQQLFGDCPEKVIWMPAAELCSFFHQKTGGGGGGGGVGGFGWGTPWGTRLEGNFDYHQ